MNSVPRTSKALDIHIEKRKKGKRTKSFKLFEDSSGIPIIWFNRKIYKSAAISDFLH